MSPGLRLAEHDDHALGDVGLVYMFICLNDLQAEAFVQSA
jgi:hypothetical protein